MPDNVFTPDNGFRNVLNSHGHPFQYSVIRAAEQSHRNGKSACVFEWAEFPVRVGNRDTRIDLVLRRGNSLTYLLGECKRVNPALGRWCFARAPYTHREPNSQKLIVESIDVKKMPPDVAVIEPQRPYRLVHGVTTARSRKIFHLGLELRTNEKGDSQGAGGRGAIEEAVGQVLLGMNGMVEHIARHQDTLESGYRVYLIPVIFTTAGLWTSEVDLGTADLETGNISPDAVTLTPEPWIWLNHNQSPGLKHSMPLVQFPPDVLETEYTRSIAIVNALGIESFLRGCEV